LLFKTVIDVLNSSIWCKARQTVTRELDSEYGMNKEFKCHTFIQEVQMYSLYHALPRESQYHSDIETIVQEIQLPSIWYKGTLRACGQHQSKFSKFIVPKLWKL